jgi:beta-phosphoglucomutase-like phosphatase (HAD superfamily)
LKAFQVHHPAGSVSANEDRARGRSPNRPGSRRRHHRLATEAVRSAQPPIWLANRTRTADELPFSPSAFIFDVEGTLIDNVLATLQCWSETLAEIGRAASVADLHPYSGSDGRRMLRRLLNRHDSKLLDHIVALQSERYRLRYLPQARPFRGLRRLFAIIKESGGKIALASACHKDEFAHYRSITNVDDLIDSVCCGDDAKREDVVSLAAKKLRLPPGQIAMVGDTPSDAEAARAAGLYSIGVQSGHFSRSDLLDAGCASVFFDLQALAQKLEERAADLKERAAADPDGLRSHTAAMAESH